MCVRFCFCRVQDINKYWDRLCGLDRLHAWQVLLVLVIIRWKSLREYVMLRCIMSIMCFHFTSFSVLRIFRYAFKSMQIVSISRYDAYRNVTKKLHRLQIICFRVAFTAMTLLAGWQEWQKSRTSHPQTNDLTSGVLRGGLAYLGVISGKTGRLTKDRK